MQIKKVAKKGINVQIFLNVIMKPIYAFFYKLLNRGVHLMLPSYKEAFTPTSSGLGMGQT
jgi:hypothetical protein